MSAYYPSQREIEEYLAKSEYDSPSTFLLKRPDLLSVKRENFKYALRKTLPAFFDLLKNLKYDGFPVQDPPLIIGGGVAVSIITGKALDTPDLDVELSGFRLDTAGGNANASVILAAGSNSGTLFSKYCHSLFEQIRGFIAGNPAMFSAYGEIIEEERNHDIEVRNGQIRGEKVANIWLSMIYNEGFFSKIVILAKIGEFVETINRAEKHAPYIERILEIKLPKKIFTPLPLGEALIHKEDIGLWFASREKMLPEILKSFGDKCWALSRLAKDYDTRIFPNVLAHDGYFDLIEEPQRREEIINYKVRIITLRERLRVLGIDAESISICSPFLTLTVIPFTTDAEKTDAAEEARLAEERRLEEERIAEAAAQAEAARLAEEERRLEEEKKAKREAKKARVAAEKAAAEQAAAAKAAEIEAAKAAAKLEAEEAARAKAEEERQQSEKILKAQADKKAKKAERAARAAAQVERASPTLSESSSTGSAGGGAEEVAASAVSAVSAAGGGAEEAVAVEEPKGSKEIIKNNGFIYFTEDFSIDPPAILNDLYTTLQINFPIAGIPEPPVLILELNSIDRFRLAERAPLYPKIIHIMDDDSLNHAETIVCKIIPNLFALNTIEQKDIKLTLLGTAGALIAASWDIQDTPARKKFIKVLSLWNGEITSGIDFKREIMQSSFRLLLRVSVEIFDILCQQVHVQKKSNYFVEAYDSTALLSIYKSIDSYLAQINPLRFTATIPVQAVLDLSNQFEGLYCLSKVKNLLFTLDAAYPTYAAVIDKSQLLKPVMLIGHLSYLSIPMINLIQQFCTRAGIQKIAGIFPNTAEFLGIGKMVKSPCQETLLAQLYEKLRSGHEERALNIEITLQKSRHLWYGNAAIMNEVCQLITVLLKRKKFITCNRSHFWQRFSVNKAPIADFLAPYERLVEERDMVREEKLGENFYDAEFAAKQKLILAKEEGEIKAEAIKQKEAENKDIEQRIQTLVELGMTVDEATIQVARNMEEAEGAGSAGGAGGAGGAGSGSASKRQPKGKVKKLTRKNLRQRSQ